MNGERAPRGDLGTEESHRIHEISRTGWEHLSFLVVAVKHTSAENCRILTTSETGTEAVSQALPDIMKDEAFILVSGGRDRASRHGDGPVVIVARRPQRQR